MWKEASCEAENVLERAPLSDSEERAAARFGDEALLANNALRESAGYDLVGKGNRREQEVNYKAVNGTSTGHKNDSESLGLVYDLLGVVVHRGTAYSGHYHALIKDSLQEVGKYPFFVTLVMCLILGVRGLRKFGTRKFL